MSVCIGIELNWTACGCVCAMLALALPRYNIDVSHLYRILLRHSSISLIVVVLFSSSCSIRCAVARVFSDIYSMMCSLSLVRWRRSLRRRVRVLLEQLAMANRQRDRFNASHDYKTNNNNWTASEKEWGDRRLRVWRSKDGHRLVVFYFRISSIGIVSTSVLYKLNFSCIRTRESTLRYALAWK